MSPKIPMDVTDDQHKHAPTPAPPLTHKNYPPPPPTATGVPVGIIPQHELVKTPWTTGLCGCFEDVSNCCVTFWCPCITFGQISEIVDQGSSSCGVNGTVYALLMYLTGCGCLLSCYYRTKMRRLYMLKDTACSDNAFSDVCLHFWCEWCALCQEYRELKNRGFDMALGWHGNIANSSASQMAPPIAPQGMKR